MTELEETGLTFATSRRKASPIPSHSTAAVPKPKAKLFGLRSSRSKSNSGVSVSSGNPIYRRKTPQPPLPRKGKMKEQYDNDYEDQGYSSGKTRYTPAPPVPRSMFNSDSKKAQPMAPMEPIDDFYNRKVMEMEDSDYFDIEDELREIQDLPFWERIWAKKLPQRSLVAGIAVLLVWLTSLGFVKFIIEEQFFPKPSIQEVGTALERLYNFSDDQRIGYDICSQLFFQNCENNYYAAHDAERLGAIQTLAANEDSLIEYEFNRSDSKTKLNDTLNMLIYMTDDLGLSLATYLTTTDNATCPRVLNWVRGQVSAALASGQFTDFTELTDEAIDGLIEQMIARENYDREYFQNKTVEAQELADELALQQEQAINDIMAKLEVNFSTFSDCLTNSSGSCTGLSMIEVLENFEEQAGLDKGELATFLAGQAADMETFLAKVDEIRQFVNSPPVDIVYPAGQAPPADAAAEPVIDITNLFLDVIRADQIANISAEILVQGQNAVNSTQAIAGDAINDYNQASTNGPDLEAGYDPPGIDTAPQVDWEEVKNETTEDFNSIMDTFQSAEEESVDDSFSSPNILDTEFPDTPEDFVALLPKRELDLFSYESEIFQRITLRLSTAVNLAVYADYIYRIARTIMVINKYWNLSSIGKPPGDARLVAISGKKWGQKDSKAERFAKLLTHPAVIYLVTVVFAAVIGWAFWRLYSPFYLAFEDSCVIHDAEDVINNVTNGTMITRNLFTLAFGYAAADGDAIQTSSVDKLNVQREVDCEANFQNSSETFDNQLKTYNAIVEDFAVTLGFHEEIIRCLKLDDLDTDLLAAEPSNPFRFVDTMNDDVFESDFVLLDEENAVYNCSSVPVCDPLNDEDNCLDGFNANEAKFLSDAHDTGCSTELWIHASLLASILVVFTFILMQFFFFEFMKAIVRIWWRDLNPYEFTFLGSCTREGLHIDPEYVAEEGNPLEDYIREQLAKALRSWERKGVFNLLYAIALHAPWLFLAIWLSSGVDYDFDNIIV